MDEGPIELKRDREEIDQFRLRERIPRNLKRRHGYLQDSVRCELSGTPISFIWTRGSVVVNALP